MAGAAGDEPKAVAQGAIRPHKRDLCSAIPPI